MDTHSQDYFLPFQEHKQSKAPFQDHKLPANPISQDHLTTADVRDIIALKTAFPNSFDTTGNMPGQYTMRVDSSVRPVQHAQRKVLIEAREETEKHYRRWLKMELLPLLLSPLNGFHHLHTPGSLMVLSAPV